MGRIADRFAALRERGDVALVPFVTAGDPDLDWVGKTVSMLRELGH